MNPFFRNPEVLLTSAVFLTISWVGARAAGQSPQTQPVLDQFAVAGDGDVLLLPVTCAGKDHLFLLDTGSFLSVFDTSFALGPPRQTVPVDTVCGVQPVELFDAPDGRVGGLHLRCPYVLRSDLAMLRHVSGHEIRGVLGMDFLGSRIVQIDFSAGRVSFLRSLPADPGTPLPISRDRAGPCVPANLSGLSAPEKFLVDTGSVYFGNIKKETAEALSRQGRAKTIGSALTAGLVGAETKVRWSVECLTVAGVPCPDAVLTQTQDNLLGLGFLSGYTATFDFPGGFLYLKGNGRPRLGGQIDRSGLHLLRIDGKTVVHSIDAGSAAATAGVLPDDVLHAVDGEPAEQQSMFAIRKRLCSESRAVRLTILRGGKLREIMAHLGHDPGPAGVAIP